MITFDPVPSNSARLARLAGASAALVIAAALLGPALSASAAKTERPSRRRPRKPSLECSADAAGLLVPGRGLGGHRRRGVHDHPHQRQHPALSIHGYPAVRFYTSCRSITHFRLRTHQSVLQATVAEGREPRAERSRVLQSRQVSMRPVSDTCRHSSTSRALHHRPPWVEHAHGRSAQGSCRTAKARRRTQDRSLGISPIVASSAQLSP